MHARFLVYLETWPYFRDPGARKLTAPEFTALDGELASLEARLGELAPEQAARRLDLRHLLMLD
jgi:hypothetical protein